MKHTFTIALCTIIGTLAGAQSYSEAVIDHMLRLSGPQAPAIVGDTVVFTAPSSYRRAGIAFAHEGFAAVHWFKKFMRANEDAGPWLKDKPPADMYRDSGILFYVASIPENLAGELEYRLILDGLWVRDPANPRWRSDSSGAARSVLSVPRVERPGPPRASGNALTFTFHAPPGHTVYLAGSFNNWDPFMYQLSESSPGRYTLSLPLPPGTYQYAFFRHGERILDPLNPVRVYSRDGKGASQLTVEP